MGVADDYAPFGFGVIAPQAQAAAIARNAQWTKPGAPYNTALAPGVEQQFRSWIASNKVPFDPNQQGPGDYDMRGFYQALQAGHPLATAAIDPNDKQMHYPDYWKTPLHQTFSNQSQWATPNAPQWTPTDKLVDASGNVLFDDRDQNSYNPFGFSVPSR